MMGNSFGWVFFTILFLSLGVLSVVLAACEYPRKKKP